MPATEPLHPYFPCVTVRCDLSPTGHSKQCAWTNVHEYFPSTNSQSGLQQWYFLRATRVPHMDLTTFYLQTACIYTQRQFWRRLKWYVLTVVKEQLKRHRVQAVVIVSWMSRTAWTEDINPHTYTHEANARTKWQPLSGNKTKAYVVEWCQYKSSLSPLHPLCWASLCFSVLRHLTRPHARIPPSYCREPSSGKLGQPPRSLSLRVEGTRVAHLSLLPNPFIILVLQLGINLLQKPGISGLTAQSMWWALLGNMSHHGWRVLINKYVLFSVRCYQNVHLRGTHMVTALMSMIKLSRFRYWYFFFNFIFML